MTTLMWLATLVAVSTTLAALAFEYGWQSGQEHGERKGRKDEIEARTYADERHRVDTGELAQQNYRLGRKHGWQEASRIFDPLHADATFSDLTELLGRIVEEEPKL